MRRPLFEVIVPADAEARRLIPVSVIRTLTGIPVSGEGAVSDAVLGQLIDAALAQAATSCGLAKARGLSPTLASEEVRASWPAEFWSSWRIIPQHYSGAVPSQIMLPWRAPITEIAVTEGETLLVENTDYRLLGSGVLERMSGCWSGSIVVNYTAGFNAMDELGSEPIENVIPPDLVSLFADQIRMMNDRAALDLNLRSEDIPGVWSGTFNVAGGSSIDTGGLMMPLYDALAAYRAPPVFA